MIPRGAFRLLLLCTILFARPISTISQVNLYSEPDPSKQVEGDWVDNRWNRTEVGQFLATILETPEGRILKGLAIKVGDNDEGAIAFDSAKCIVRAGWLGGFLKFDPARYGLISAPKATGDYTFSVPNGFGFESTSNRYTGLHLRGKRVVLEYQVDGIRVLDSPWLESAEDVRAFTRSLELEATTRTMSLALLAEEKQPIISQFPGGMQSVTKNGSDVSCVAVLGRDVKLLSKNGKLTLALPPRTEPLQVKVLIWNGSEKMLPKFQEIIQRSGQVQPVSRLLKPGPARWLPELQLAGQRGLDSDFLAVDTLTVPYENPWKALMFLAGVDFTPDGAAYVCTIHGDVWRVTGIDDKLAGVRWKRFATGLFQPLGLKVRDGKIYVLGRDQITCVQDLNSDGEADFYENFCNLIQTATGHSYVSGLEKDAAGNFYYVDPIGVHKVNRDGSKRELLATGFRNPNGLGVSPDGKIITVAPQQGNWTPSSEICEIKQGGYYGFGGPKANADRSTGFDTPLCWIPHWVDNSSGSQVWVPSGQWGPLSGQLLHLLWGRCRIALVLRDVVDGTAQGAVVSLPGRFLSGPHRGSFNAKDGHLYVAGSTGWQTSAVKEGSFQRVRFTGKRMLIPVGWHARPNGLTLTFSEPLEESSANDPGSFGVRRWNYRYASEYGSKEWSVLNPNNPGRDEVQVKSAKLQPDQKTVFLELVPMGPAMQLEVSYNLNGADGKPARNQLWLTLNRTGSEKN